MRDCSSHGERLTKKIDLMRELKEVLVGEMFRESEERIGFKEKKKVFYLNLYIQKTYNLILFKILIR